MRSSIKGVTPEWYTLADEIDDPQPTRFYLKPLDGFASVDITFISMVSKTSTAESAAALAGSEVLKRAFMLGVQDWENLGDGNNPGKLLPFSKAAMSLIERDIIMEVGGRVLEISNLAEAQVKN